MVPARPRNPRKPPLHPLWLYAHCWEGAVSGATTESCLLHLPLNQKLQKYSVSFKKDEDVVDYHLVMFHCLSLYPFLKHRYLPARGGQRHINSSSGSDRRAGKPVPTPRPCLFHGQVRGLPHPQTIPLYVLGTHLSMLIAQRFKMLAVHIMTSMVTKISQQMRLKVQTPPVTCSSNQSCQPRSARSPNRLCIRRSSPSCPSTAR